MVAANHIYPLSNSFEWIKDNLYKTKIINTLLWIILISYAVFFHLCLKDIGRSTETIFLSAIITASGIGLYLAYCRITKKKYVDLADDINKSLAHMSEKDTGEFLAFIVNLSNEIKDHEGVDLYDPQSVKEKCPNFSEKIIKYLDNNNINSPISWSMLVWWFTLHAVSAEEYRYDVKSMWKKLASGAPYLESMDPKAYAALIGRKPDLSNPAFDDFGRIPKGFE